MPETPYGDPGLAWEAVRNVWIFSALHAFVALGCADRLWRGALSVEELARQCEAHTASLARVLRTVTAAGFTVSTGPGTFALTESGEALCTQAPHAARLSILEIAEEASWRSQGSVPTAVRQGRPAFLGQSAPYDYRNAHPEAGRVFDKLMQARSLPVAASLAARYDFSRVGTLVDVGGGGGTFLSAILRAYPHISGILLELPDVVAGARQNLAAEGLADRCKFVAGDFFESVPKGDTYLLSSVVHNWDDEKALRILTNVRASLGEGGQILIVEMVIPDDDRPHLGKDLDMRMLAMYGGQERTRSEYIDLLGRAGLRVIGMTVLAAHQLSVIEARSKLV